MVGQTERLPQVRLTVQLKIALETESLRTGASMSEIVRRALREYLQGEDGNGNQGHAIRR